MADGYRVLVSGWVDVAEVDMYWILARCNGYLRKHIEFSLEKYLLV